MLHQSEEYPHAFDSCVSLILQLTHPEGHTVHKRECQLLHSLAKLRKNCTDAMIHAGPSTVLVIVIASEGLRISEALKGELDLETEVAG